MDQCKETSRKIKMIHSFKIQDHKMKIIWSSKIIFSQQTKKTKKQKREGETTTRTTQSIECQIKTANNPPCKYQKVNSKPIKIKTGLRSKGTLLTYTYR